MKKFWITLLSVLTFALCLFGIVACNKGGKVLANYALAQDGTLVEEDFVLPLKVSDKEVIWTSDNEEAIAVEKRAEDYLAKVILGDETTNVKLTVACGKEMKEFNVTVAALDVSMFVKKFTFAQDKATVYEDFELPTSYTINGKTATIDWAVERDEDKNYIRIEKEDAKLICRVKQSSLNPVVKLFATFSYNGKTQVPNYDVTVSFEREHQEEVDYWYYNTGVSIKMSGYVVAIGTAYSESYGNVTLYMVDDDFCAGYYLYRVKADKENGAKLKAGVHVTVTGTTNTNYNGLVETNAGGTLVVDENPKDKEGNALPATIDVSKSVYAIDNDLLAGTPEALYHTSRLVSLTNWVVDSVESKAPTAGNTATLFTLKKGNVKVAVGVSKYMEGVYATKAGDTTWEGLCALQSTVAKGDVVSVTGILGNFKGFQIMPMKAADVTVTKAADATDVDTSVAQMYTNVFNAIREVQSAFKSNGVTSFTDDANVCFKPNAGYTVVADKEFNVPTSYTRTDADASEKPVEIKYELLHDSDTVAIGTDKITVTVGVEDIASIKVTYTVKDGADVVYSTSTYHTLHSKNMTDEQVVANIRFNFELEQDSTAVDSVTLATGVAQYPGATISWALKEPVEGVTLTGNKLEVVPSLTADRNVVLLATFSYGTVTSAPKEFDFKVIKIDPVETGTFKLVLEQANLKKTLYFTGELSGNYGATSEDYFDAADVVIAEVEGGYTLKVGEKYLELDDKHHVVLVDTATDAWKYDYTKKVFTWTVTAEGKTYYLGTYKTYNTISASTVDKITGDRKTDTENGNFVAFFEKPVAKPDAEVVDAALAKVPATLPAITEAGETVLPVSKVSGATFSWALAEDTTVATLGGGKLTVATLPAANTEITLTLSVTCGEVTKTKTVKVTVKAAMVIPEGATTASVTIADYKTANNWANNTKYTSLTVDTNVTVAVAGGSNSGKYYDAGSEWRTYQNENPTITVSAATGYKIAYVKITYNISNTGVLTNADKTVQYASEEYVAVNGASVTFSVGNTGTVTNGQVKITAIEVVYVADAE